MRDYIITDVFTDAAYGGNPLAVFLDGSALATRQMQAIAREMNLSETTFVTPLDEVGRHWRVRIFTPARELPFAGHPTVGTAVVLAERGLTRGQHELVFEEGVGPVRVSLAPGAATLFMAGPAETRPLPLGREDVAEILGIEPDAIVGAPWQAGYGSAFVLVPVRDVATVARAYGRHDHLARHAGALWGHGVMVYAVTEHEPGRAALHARMFAPTSGIAEDPATGSAAAALAGSIEGLGQSPSGTLRLSITQGVEMGRPSHIATETSYADGAVASVSVGGHAVVVGEGRLLRLP